MLREIYEQPRAALNALANYLPAEGRENTLRDVRLTADDLRAISKINIVASGASRHAGLVGEFIIERLSSVPVEVDYASQYCYREPLTQPNELTILLTQSGTTADTIAALREAKARGAKTLAICNVEGAPITRESDGNIYTHAGEEISVAATKSFTSQLLALFVLAVHLGSVRRSLTAADTREHLHQVMMLPEKLEQALACDEQCKSIALAFQKFDDFMFLGRDASFPIALEGALKLKETAYIHAEGFPTGEMKHGPSALVDGNLPVVMILTKDDVDAASRLRYNKSLSVAKEIASRGTKMIALGCAGDEELKRLTPNVVTIPAMAPLLSTILEIVPLQLLAYHIAVLRGVDVDRPRNLSKSVTTE
jgi:glutamine---fructose-6-phosphate transaminase (isomerizing)